MTDLHDFPAPPPEDEATLLMMDKAELQAANEAPLPPRIGQSLPGSIERMRRRVRGEEQPVPLPWPRVAEALGGGLWPGLHVLVGNTGTGKSQWSLQIAYEAARQGIPVLYIPLELSSFALDARLLGLATKRKWSPLFLGRDPDGLEDAVSTHAAALSALPIHVEEAPPYGWTYDRLRPLAERLRHAYRAQLRGRPPLVVLDYLQLVASPTGQRDDLRERIQQTAYQARHVAKTLDAAVLLVSSTARHNYDRLDPDDGKPPWNGPAHRFVGYGKESGEVEYAADCCLTLLREPWGGDTPPPDGTRIHLAVAKLRHGTETWCDLRFDGSLFTEPPQERVTPRRARR
jgi:replicative DNA helicase